MLDIGRYCQRWFEIVRGCQRLLEIVRYLHQTVTYCQRLSKNCQRLPDIVKDCQRWCEMVRYCQILSYFCQNWSMIVRDCQILITVVIKGCQMMSKVVKGCQRLSKRVCKRLSKMVWDCQRLLKDAWGLEQANILLSESVTKNLSNIIQMVEIVHIISPIFGVTYTRYCICLFIGLMLTKSLSNNLLHVVIPSLPDLLLAVRHTRE